MASLNHTGRRGRFNRGPWRRANAPSFFSVIDSPLGFAASLVSSYIVASSKMRPAPPALSSSPKMAALACASRRLGAPLPNRRKATRYAWSIHRTSKDLGLGRMAPSKRPVLRSSPKMAADQAPGSRHQRRRGSENDSRAMPGRSQFA